MPSSSDSRSLGAATPARPGSRCAIGLLAFFFCGSAHANPVASIHALVICAAADRELGPPAGRGNQELQDRCRRCGPRGDVGAGSGEQREVLVTRHGRRRSSVVAPMPRGGVATARSKADRRHGCRSAAARQRVLDLHALEEPQAAVNPIRHRLRSESLPARATAHWTDTGSRDRRSPAARAELLDARQRRTPPRRTRCRRRRAGSFRPRRDRSEILPERPVLRAIGRCGVQDHAGQR